jgi:hypothetical protein
MRWCLKIIKTELKLHMLSKNKKLWFLLLGIYLASANGKKSSQLIMYTDIYYWIIMMTIIENTGDLLNSHNSDIC